MLCGSPTGPDFQVYRELDDICPCASGRHRAAVTSSRSRNVLWRDSREESHSAWRGMRSNVARRECRHAALSWQWTFLSGVPPQRMERRAQTPLPWMAWSSPELVKTRRLRCAEFLMGHRCRFVVVRIEIGGRLASGLCWLWSTDVFSSVTISQCRTQTKPSVTCHSRSRGVAHWFAVALSVLSTGRRLPSG